MARSISHKPSHTEPVCRKEPRLYRTKEKSLSLRFQQRRSRGRRYDRHPKRSISQGCIEPDEESIAAYYGKIATDGAGCGLQWVCGTQESCSDQRCLEGNAKECATDFDQSSLPHGLPKPSHR